MYLQGVACTQCATHLLPRAGGAPSAPLRFQPVAFSVLPHVAAAIQLAWHSTVVVCWVVAGQPKVRLRAHSSSVLWRVSTPWVLFFQAKQGESGWYDMQELVAIEPEWLPELAPHMFSTARPTL